MQDYNPIPKDISGVKLLKQPTEEDVVQTTISRMSHLASLVRHAGALGVLVAMSLFLFQGWSDGNDISRYYTLLWQTVLLAGGGFGMSYILKDNKGARLMFGLGVVSVTVNLTTLSALIFSAVTSHEFAHLVPTFAQWQGVSVESVLLPLAATLAISLPVIAVTYKIFIGKEWKLFAGTFIAANLFILLPFRESFMAGAVAMGAIILPAVMLHIMSKRDATPLMTREGALVSLTLFAPAAIIMTRSIALYDVDATLGAMLSFAGIMLTRLLVNTLQQFKSARPVLDIAASLMSFAFAATVADIIDVKELFIFSYVTVGLFLFIAKDSPFKRGLRDMSGIILAIAVVVSAMGYVSFSAMILQIATVAIIFFMGVKFNSKLHFVGAGIAAFMVAKEQLYNLFTMIEFSSWAVFGTVGLLCIIGATLIERYGAIAALSKK